MHYLQRTKCDPWGTTRNCHSGLQMELALAHQRHLVPFLIQGGLTLWRSKLESRVAEEPSQHVGLNILSRERLSIALLQTHDRFYWLILASFAFWCHLCGCKKSRGRVVVETNCRSVVEQAGNLNVN